jgi:hypothetical protein
MLFASCLPGRHIFFQVLLASRPQNLAVRLNTDANDWKSPKKAGDRAVLSGACLDCGPFSIGTEGLGRRCPNAATITAGPMLMFWLRRFFRLIQ